MENDVASSVNDEQGKMVEEKTQPQAAAEGATPAGALNAAEAVASSQGPAAVDAGEQGDDATLGTSPRAAEDASPKVETGTALASVPAAAQDAQQSQSAQSNQTEPRDIVPDASAASFCSKCGAPLKPGMPFCGQCGAKVAVTQAAAPATLGPVVSKPKGFNFKPVIAGVAALAVVVILAVVVVPEVTATPDQLLEKGRYEDAFNRASTDQKADVITKIVDAGQYQLAYSLASDDQKPEVLEKTIAAGEFQTAYDMAADDQKDGVLLTNLAAVLSVDLIDDLKDSASYVLRSLYFDEDGHQIVMKVQGNNSYGAGVCCYYYYTFNSSVNGYQLYTYVSDLSAESIYYSDSYSTRLEKALKNKAREKMRSIIGDDANKLNDTYINAVNDLFQSKGLNDVNLLDAASAIYPSGSGNSTGSNA